MSHYQDNEWKSLLGSDSPKENPDEDLFGYNTFAKRLAKAIERTPSPKGLVIALNGQWGSGKSTVLNFVKYHLNALPVDKPVVVEFNPWWIAGSDQLAAQFLLRFSEEVPPESEPLRKVGDLIAKYSGELSLTVGTAFGLPSPVVKAFFDHLKREEKSIPDRKAQVAKALQSAGRRFLFIIDDIDRLTPQEASEVFKVVKALADFPNVIYLLAFDKEQVANAITKGLSTDGERFLEKIVQAEFTMPALNPVLLHQMIDDEVMKLASSLRDHNFSRERWVNFYRSGLDQYVQKPRDAVRIINILSVTYPMVVGELDPIDFIGLEFVRLFDPQLYGIFKENREMFAIPPWSTFQKEDIQEFQRDWTNQLPENRREVSRKIAERLFFQIGEYWTHRYFPYEDPAQAKKNLRVSSHELVDVFFEFGFPDGCELQRNVKNLIRDGDKPEVAKQLLLKFSDTKFPGGRSLCEAVLLDLEHRKEEISSDSAAGILRALADVGDRLSFSTPYESMKYGGTAWPGTNVLELLLSRIEPSSKPQLLEEMVSTGDSLVLLADILRSLQQDVESDELSDPGWKGLEKQHVPRLHEILVKRFQTLTDEQFLDCGDLLSVVYWWFQLPEKESLRQRVEGIVMSDVHFPQLLERIISFGYSTPSGNVYNRRRARVNPQWLEDLFGVDRLETRLQEMQKVATLSPRQKQAVRLAIKAVKCRKEGRDPEHDSAVWEDWDEESEGDV